MKARCAIAGLTLATLAAVPASLDAQAQRSRERDIHEWEVKAEKMKLHLQDTMREHGIDMWVLMSRENNPDPALELFGGYGITGWYGHRNAYVFYDPGGDAALDKVVLGTHTSRFLERFFDRIESYHGDGEGLAPLLASYVRDKEPKKIAINQSRTISMADGLSAELKSYLEHAIGPEYASRLVSSEPMFIDYVSKRTPAELEIAKEAAWRTWHILRRAFSSEVITPGETTLMDVYWWIKDEWMAQDLEFNFPASFNLQRRGAQEVDEFSDPVIEAGDVLHVDFGVRLMGLVTDQQKMAYVLRPGETEAPEGLRTLFEQSVRQGEIIASTIEPGVLGVEIKDRAEARGKRRGSTTGPTRTSRATGSTESEPGAAPTGRSGTASTPSSRCEPASSGRSSTASAATCRSGTASACGWPAKRTPGSTRKATCASWPALRRSCG